jgi:hypothetical protein
MDGIIDTWHQVAHLPDGDRPDFLSNAFRVTGKLVGGGAFSWTNEVGTGLGNVELSTRWRFADRPSASAAVVARLELPSGAGAFDGHSAAAGVQLVLAAPLARRLDVYAGVGGTLQGRGPVDGLQYEPGRAHAFLAFEWRAGRTFSVFVETNAASRLVANVEAYPGLHWMLDISARKQFGSSTAVTLGFVENLASQLTTTDFALHAGVSIQR